MKKILQLLDDFIVYGHDVLGLNSLDAFQSYNRICYELQIYPSGRRDFKPSRIKHNVDYFVSQFNKYLKSKKWDEITCRIKLAKIFDMISPKPSEVAKQFNGLLRYSPAKATSYLYKLGINNHYIHWRAIKQNLEWLATYSKGNIEVTINLSKPEKNVKDIAKLADNKQLNPNPSYPLCPLCLDNLGFAGDAKRAQRQTLRIVPFGLLKDFWFLQFSPYGYFDQHCIVITYKHRPMEINEKKFRYMFAFLKRVPIYTVTSNADLPIVGGSVLNHEHLQCGKHVFPIQKAGDDFVIHTKKYKTVKASYVDFYNSAIRLVGKDPEEIIKAATEIYNQWCKFDAREIGIISHTGKTRYNTITPVIRMINAKEYEMILILRNSRTNVKYPDGIFHVHPQYYHIKKENIGVIEAMGRFILPGRLKRQMQLATKAVAEGRTTKKTCLSKYPELAGFGRMVKKMAESNMTAQQYVNDVCKRILTNISVFKKDNAGYHYLRQFIKKLDI